MADLRYGGCRVAAIRIDGRNVYRVYYRGRMIYESEIRAYAEAFAAVVAQVVVMPRMGDGERADIRAALAGGLALKIREETGGLSGASALLGSGMQIDFFSYIANYIGLFQMLLGQADAGLSCSAGVTCAGIDCDSAAQEAVWANVGASYAMRWFGGCAPMTLPAGVITGSGAVTSARPNSGLAVLAPSEIRLAIGETIRAGGRSAAFPVLPIGCRVIGGRLYGTKKESATGSAAIRCMASESRRVSLTAAVLPAGDVGAVVYRCVGVNICGVIGGVTDNVSVLRKRARFDQEAVCDLDVYSVAMQDALPI